MKPKLSIIIPAFNEAESLGRLSFEIDQVLRKHRSSAEIIFVDDGSTDNSWKEIQLIAANNERVRGIRLRRNFGKSIALKVGLEYARGELIQTLDADLQHNPKDIPRFVEKINEGYDLVNGWQQDRRDSWLKIFPSVVFNRLLRLATKLPLHDMNCGMKCFRRSIVNGLYLFNDSHRFIPVQAFRMGFRITEIQISSRPRLFGRSKYGWSRFFKVIIDVIILMFLFRYARKPPRLLNNTEKLILEKF